MWLLSFKLKSLVSRLIVILLLALGLAACSGSDSPGTAAGGPGNPPPGPSANDQVRQAIVDYYNTQVPHSSIVEDNQLVYNYMLGRSELSDVQLQAEQGLVWGFFADGEPVVFVNNLEIGSGNPARTSDLVASAQRLEAAGSGEKAVLVNLHGFSSVTGQPQATISAEADKICLQLQSKLQDHWLVQYVTTGSAETVLAQLRVAVSADTTILFINSHGNLEVPKPGQEKWLLVTGLPILAYQLPNQDPNINALAEDVGSRRVIPAAIVATEAYLEGGKKSHVATRTYCLTEAFVTRYWHLKKTGQTLVWMQSCLSGSDQSKAFRDALHGAGASIYVGWSNIVAQKQANDTVRQFFLWTLPDLTVQPPRRAFPTRDVYDALSLTHRVFPPGVPYTQTKDTFLADLRIFNLDTGDLVGSRARADADDVSLGTLLPSIRTMEALDTLLTVKGSFGDDPGEGQRSITLSGQDVTNRIVSWAPTEIVLNLDGLPGGGDVVVTVRGHLSNTAQLTRWQMLVRATSGPVRSNSSMTFNLDFRADVRSYRTAPDGDPIDRSVTILPGSGSNAQWDIEMYRPQEPGIPVPDDAHVANYTSLPLVAPQATDDIGALILQLRSLRSPAFSFFGVFTQDSGQNRTLKLFLNGCAWDGVHQCLQVGGRLPGVSLTDNPCLAGTEIEYTLELNSAIVTQNTQSSDYLVIPLDQGFQGGSGSLRLEAWTVPADLTTIPAGQGYNGRELVNWFELSWSNSVVESPPDPQGAR